MGNYFTYLFDPEKYMPHGMCLLWQPGLMGLHIVSDALIALAYYSIPVAILYFAWKRKDFPFHGVILLFSLFILACGTTHLMAIVTLWEPLYKLDGLVKAVTAAASVPTAVVLWWLMPAALKMPSQHQIERERDMAQRYLDVAGVMILALDADARVASINRKGSAILGYGEPQEVLGKSWIDGFIPPRMRQQLREVYRRLISGTDSAMEYYENPVVTKNGEEKIIAWHNAVLTDEKGHPTGTLSSGEDITDRRRAEAALAKSEAKFRAVFRDSAVGMALVSPSAQILEANGAFRVFLGYSEGEVVEKTLKDITHPEHWEATDQAISDLLAGRTSSFRIEKRFIHKSGQIKWGEANVSLVRDDRGKPEYFIAQALDITERKRAEEALAKSEAKFRTMFLDSAIGMVQVSAAGKILETNGAFRELVGYSEDELATKTMKELTHPDDWVLVSQARGETLAGKNSSFRLQKRFVQKTGQTRWTETTVSLIRDAQGEPQYLFGQAVDITERKQAEEAIRRSEAELRSFIDSAPYGIYRSSEKSDAFMSVNSALVKMLGYDTAAEVQALKLSTDLYGDADAHHKFIERLNRTESFCTTELHWKRKDGKPLTVKVRARRLRGPIGKADVMEAVVEDVTDHKALEAQFLHAQKMEAVGRLTGGVAHDFNNLLCVVVGNLELLTEGNVDRKVRKQLIQLALHAALSGSNLTQRLLTFSRRQALRPQAVRLQQLMDDFSELLRRSLGELIAVTINIETGLWPCFVDPSQLESALLNLAVNARDAMPEGGPISIDIANVVVGENGGNASSVLAPGEYVKISVSDEGGGMTEEVRQRAFEPFFTTKGDKGGSGLGLSMVYGFIMQSGGHVTIDSRIGEGTAVSIYLPRSVVDAGRSTARPKPMVRGTFSASGSVLVVEDRGDVRATACRMLSEFGFRVFAASDAMRALTLLDYIDDLRLLFSDVILPGGMNGPDLANEAVRRHPQLKVLFTSGYVADGKISGMDNGADAPLLVKPYRKADMARMLQLVLADKHSDRDRRGSKS